MQAGAGKSRRYGSAEGQAENTRGVNYPAHLTASGAIPRGLVSADENIDTWAEVDEAG